jgi:hypothetical protein
MAPVFKAAKRPARGLALKTGAISSRLPVGGRRPGRSTELAFAEDVDSKRSIFGPQEALLGGLLAKGRVLNHPAENCHRQPAAGDCLARNDRGPATEHIFTLGMSSVGRPMRSGDGSRPSVRRTRTFAPVAGRRPAGPSTFARATGRRPAGRRLVAARNVGGRSALETFQRDLDLGPPSGSFSRSTLLSAGGPAR